MNEEVSRDMTGEADGKNLGVDSRDGVMHEPSSRNTKKLVLEHFALFTLTPNMSNLIVIIWCEVKI